MLAQYHSTDIIDPDEITNYSNYRMWEVWTTRKA